jgi:hypothetical protein
LGPVVTPVVTPVVLEAHRRVVPLVLTPVVTRLDAPVSLPDALIEWLRALGGGRSRPVKPVGSRGARLTGFGGSGR